MYNEMNCLLYAVEIYNIRSRDIASFSHWDSRILKHKFTVQTHN